MIFNSLPFILFFAVIFFLYWFVTARNTKLQNILLLAAGYFFYSWWDWRFSFLLLGCSAISYLVGLRLPSTEDKKKKYILCGGIIIEVLVLIYFKYANFFITSFIDVFDGLGIQVHLNTLKIILPLGISFYIFRTIGYLLDVYYGKTKPESNIIVYFVYVSYFPSLVNGPIDRANLLIPQLHGQRVFSYEQQTDGLKQFLWGLAKKILIANNCAVFANAIFSAPEAYTGSALLLGAFFYTIQLYADFSGYSDMAIGISNLLGIRITQNFNFPFFAQNIADYWKRWHISLTSWLTDYVFTPISIHLRDWNKFGLIVSIFITYLLIGFWHGPNWTFVLFGFLHGLYYIPLILKGSMNKKKKLSSGMFPSFLEFRNMLATFVLVMLTNIIFRVENIEYALKYIKRLFSASLFSMPQLNFGTNLIVSVFFIFLFFITEWFGRKESYAFAKVGTKWRRGFRWGLYYLLICLISFYAAKEEIKQPFIYFQF